MVLNFNMIFGEQIVKMLKLENPQPEIILNALLELNNKSSFLMYKTIIYCGILGNDYITGIEESVTQEEVASLILDCNAEQLNEVFTTLSKELGFNLNVEIEDGNGNVEKKN